MYRLVADSLPYYLESIKNGGFANSCRKTRIAVGDSGNIWFAFTGGVFRIRESGIGRGGSPERFEIPGMDARASSILRDRNGNLWIGYNNGIVVRYNPAENFFTKFRLPEKYNEDNQPDIIVIQEDKSGNIWLATQTDGIFRLAPGKDRIEKFITLEELHGSKYISSLLDFIIDSNGELWIATFRGLFRVRQDDMKITNYTGFDNTGKTYLNNYLRIHEDQNRNIWILNCLEGPYLFNRENETFLKVKIPALQPSLGFDDMLFDRRGKIWLARYDRLTVIDTLTNSVKDFFLPICGFDVQSLCLKSGTRLFIINSGLFIFIDDIPLNRGIPPVYITSIFINNIQNNALFQDSAAVTELTKIDLKSGQNNIRIDYAALNYNQPELNRYRYFMSGLDEDTTEAGTIMRTEYRQMPPGHYKFWVTGSNNDGIWNPVGTSFEIRIHPPWYRSTVACFVYLISFIFMLTGILRFRTYSLRKEKVRLESEVKARTADLEIKNRQLAETDRIKTHFFTDISHEIRTPLSLISGPLDILSREGYHDERESDMIEMMKRNVNRLVQMVNQLLDISRLDAGKMRIMLSEGDLIKFLRILIFEFLSLAESKQIKYIAEMPDEEFITWFDRDKTEKIISNLLTNAFKFTPQGGTVKCRIEINYDESKKLRRVLKFIVTDSGKGISREYIHKIFNRFFREDESGETEGTGIGLSLAKEFVCLLHGNIQVTSESGQGSEFTVFIPLGKEHLAPDEYIIVKTEEQEKKTILHKPVFNNLPGENITHESRVNILLIEDNTDLRNFLQMNLSDKYNILCAENGKTGLHTALTMMPDLIVTDIMMPDLDGISLCYQLKNNELTSHIPIILLTAKSTLTDKIEGIRSGADDYIIKPFNTDELKARISNLLLLREKLKQKYGNYNKLSKIDEQIISVDDKFLNKVVMIINENLSDFDFNVEVLHEKIGMSRMHLNRKLKILTGMPPGLIIRNMRLEKAAELLMHRAGNITEIANSVGISNPSYFTKAFRIYFGVSPKEYSKYNI